MSEKTVAGTDEAAGVRPREPWLVLGKQAVVMRRLAAQATRDGLAGVVNFVGKACRLGCGLVLFGGAGIALLIFLAKRGSNPKPSVFGNAMPAANTGLNGPQAFGGQAPAPYGPQGAAPNGPQGGAPYGQQQYGQQYGQQNGQQYAPNQGPGMGGRIMGGVATGLAVGAGFMAAEAIGRNLMGGEEGKEANAAAPESHHAPPDTNADMGGQDFGIQDSGSWDSGGGDSWD